MRWRHFYFFILLFGFQWTLGQQMELKFQLVDEITKKPIPDAHVFISDASIGSTSDAQGLCEIKVAAQETQTLIISHLSYELLVIQSERFAALTDGVPVTMKANGINLSEIAFTAKRSNKWKKNFRTFKRALLGEGTPASKCKILNPEVLRFEDQNGKLVATAIDLLEIDNDYLGYNIRFLLEELSVEEDGSRFYKGYINYKDKANLNTIRIKRREKAYKNSLAHFLSYLVVSPDKATLENYGYQVAMERYNQGEFFAFEEPEPSDLIQYDSSSGFYHLFFSEFLSVKHTQLKEDINSEQKLSVSRAEQKKYGMDRSVSMNVGRENPISRLYKIKSHLVFERRGNIINKNDVREYNYWADQRLATSLPVDYKKFSDFEQQTPLTKSVDTLLVFKNLVGPALPKKEEAINFLADNWSNSYIPPLLDILFLSQDDWHQQKIRALLKKQVADITPTYFEGSQWLWKNAPIYGSYYGQFKGHLYAAIDPAFDRYFYDRGQQSKIRLDEIVWGGVKQDGIPPLRSPKMIGAESAQYLSDRDVVFGLVINGQAYAYPKRILAWHEFFTAELEGQSIAGVYCTLCGTVIVYNTEVNGIKHELGTSGFLYRSNKLMYDQATQSLWSTIQGRPVVGPLIDQNIELATLPVETTTWGEWSARHPNTQALSIETGHARNYEEGEAYKEYFATDALMFPVPKNDKRLANKARVFIPRPMHYQEDPLAISVDYLKRKRMHQDQIGDQHLLIISEKNGASRAYAIDQPIFKSYKQGKLMDQNNQLWDVSEEALIGPAGERFARLAAHEVFWFAWVNVFSGTRIVY